MEKFVEERTLDSSKASLNALGRHVGELLSVQLIYDCPLYYRTYDSLRTVGFKQFNKDAVQMGIASLTAIDSIKRRNGFYTQRGILYVKVGAFDQALQDFETAVRLSQATGETLYFKAWMHEQKKEYDLALELYDFMIAQSNIAVFKMATAYVKKKKELEKERGFYTDYTNYIVQSRLRLIVLLICYIGINHCKIIK